VRAALIAALLGSWLACSNGPRAPQPLHLEIVRAGRDTRVTLVPAADLKLNARLKPALELRDGTLLRFDSPRLTPDSAYFAEPPTATLRDHLGAVHGTLRASVCGVNEAVCRAITVEL
jgi:hypothetical protein